MFNETYITQQRKMVFPWAPNIQVVHNIHPKFGVTITLDS